jgi:hypothetical protein
VAGVVAYGAEVFEGAGLLVWLIGAVGCVVVCLAGAGWLVALLRDRRR